MKYLCTQYHFNTLSSKAILTTFATVAKRGRELNTSKSLHLALCPWYLLRTKSYFTYQCQIKSIGIMTTDISGYFSGYIKILFKKFYIKMLNY